MNENEKNELYQQFETDSELVRKRVRRTNLLQNIVWLFSFGIGAVIFGWIVYQHLIQHIPLEQLAPDVLSPIMTASYAMTTGYIIFIFLYATSVRAIYHAYSVLHTQMKNQLAPHEHPSFSWHSYFKKTGRESRSGLTVITGIIIKTTSLFAIITFSLYAWMHLMEITGQSLTDEHWAYLGGPAITLISSLILFAVVLLVVRVAALGAKNRDHQKAKSLHPPQDPARAR